MSTTIHAIEAELPADSSHSNPPISGESSHPTKRERNKLAHVDYNLNE